MKKIGLLSIFLFSVGHLLAQVIYLSSTNNRIYRLDILTCDYEEVVRVSHAITDISFHPDGTLYGISGNGNLFEIDTISGLITGVHDFDGQIFNSLTTSGDGTIYATGDEGALWSYNVSNDQAIFYGIIGFRATGDLTFYKGNLYVAVQNDRIVLIDINNPPNSRVVVDDDVDGEVFGIVSYSESCDSINCYAVSSGDSEIYLINFPSAALQLVCSLNIRIGGGASTYEFLGSAPTFINELLVVHTACHQDNGSITIIVTGAAGPLAYSMDGLNFQSQNIFDHLAGGNYSLVVRDANGCTITEEVTLMNTDGPVIENIAMVPATCGQANGELAVSVNAANGTVGYSIDGVNFQTSPIFSNLNSGTYLITVRDTAGCTSNDQTELTATEAATIENVIVTSPICIATTGSLTVEAKGPLLEYSIDGNQFQQSNQFSQLIPADHVIIIKDENGCMDTVTAVIEPAVPLLIDQIVSVGSTCGGNDGSILITPNGGTGQIQYSLDGVLFQDNNLFDTLSPSVYLITIRDEKGCIDTSTTKIDAGVPLLILQIESVSPRCDINDGSVIVTPGGGTGQIQFSINGIQYQASNEFLNLGAGNYTIDIIDEAGCRSSGQVEITESPSIVPGNITFEMPDCGESNGSISLQPSGGTGVLKVSLNGGAFVPNTTFQNLAAGENSISISDENGCIKDTTIFIKQKKCQIYIPNTFSPNQDGVNDYFELSTHGEFNVQILKYMIFDRWGNLVYSAGDFSIASTDFWWDGTFKRMSMSPGTFAYYIEVKYEDEETQIFKGDVTLVR